MHLKLPWLFFAILQTSDRPSYMIIHSYSCIKKRDEGIRDGEILMLLKKIIMYTMVMPETLGGLIQEKKTFFIEAM